MEPFVIKAFIHRSITELLICLTKTCMNRFIITPFCVDPTLFTDEWSSISQRRGPPHICITQGLCEHRSKEGRIIRRRKPNLSHKGAWLVPPMTHRRGHGAMTTVQVRRRCDPYRLYYLHKQVSWLPIACSPAGQSRKSCGKNCIITCVRFPL